MNYYDEFYTKERTREEIRNMRKYLDRSMDKTYKGNRRSAYWELTALKEYLTALLDDYSNVTCPEWENEIKNSERSRDEQITEGNPI